MALQTYTDLQTSVANWMHRTDLTSMIPDFILMAEMKISHSIRSRYMEAPYLGTLTSGIANFALPVDYSSMKGIKIEYALDGSNNSGSILQLLPYNLIRQYLSAPDATPGMPRYYTIEGPSIKMYPIPDQNYLIYINYYQDVPSLAVNNTNWVMTRYPMVYLYGALIEACTFIQDEERTQLYQARFDSAIEDIWKNYTNESFSGSPLKSSSRYIM